MYCSSDLGLRIGRKARLKSWVCLILGSVINIKFAEPNTGFLPDSQDICSYISPFYDNYNISISWSLSQIFSPFWH